MAWRPEEPRAILLPSSACDPARCRGQPYRTGPILNIARELELFEHVEAPANRACLFPQIPGGFNVVRAGELERHGPAGGEPLSDQLGDGVAAASTFSGLVEKIARTAVSRGARDTGQHLEPTI